MNPSGLTRKEQVLERLRSERGGWVDGPELASERVGGSEGLKRLRELRDEGLPIEARRHPDPRRDIWQYRLAPDLGGRLVVSPPPALVANYLCPKCKVPMVDIRTLDASGRWATGQCWSCGKRHTVMREEA